MTDGPLLSVRDLEKHYPVRSGLLKRVTGHVEAVDGVSFDLRRGETLGLVGESGCGKSTTASTVLGLEEPTGGDVFFEGTNVAEYDASERKRFRRRAQIIFQDPATAFDPRMTVGESVAEPLAIHGISDGDRRAEVVRDLLARVGLDASDANRYPDAFSGGQKQRIALARALVLNPDLLVADEPVSALDVSVQAEILSLLDDLQSQLDLSLLLISHDLGVVRQVADRVAVMYLGEIVEKGPTEQLFTNPQHPYTEALLSSIPQPEPGESGQAIDLTGDVPDPANPPNGCSFHTRCPRIIPPAAYDLESAVFRRLLDFRRAVEARDVDPAAYPDAEAVRTAHDLPESLADPEAEAVLATATAALAAGDVSAAGDQLAEAFTTVCERDSPQLRATAAGHPAACHLHDEQHSARSPYED